MIKRRISAALSLAVLGVCSIVTAASAQVIYYDQERPSCSPYTLLERSVIIPGNQDKQQDNLLQGQIYQYVPDKVITKKKKKRHRINYNDSLYGRTLELDIGMGGAHLD